MAKLSVVTINWNNAKGLQKTIDSVVRQTFTDYEYIIIDGGSTDESRKVIEQYDAQIDIAISEKDTGIYNAMNKGLAKASGVYILFLNSGDCFYSDHVLQQLFDFIEEEEDYFYGDIVVEDAKGRPNKIPSAETIFFAEKYQHNLPPQPAFFAKRVLLDKVGGFDEQYKIIADVALIAKICSMPLRYKHIDLPVTLFDNTGVSSDKENQRRIFFERKHFITQNFPSYLPDFEKLYKQHFLQSLLNKVKSLF